MHSCLQYISIDFYVTLKGSYIYLFISVSCDKCCIGYERSWIFNAGIYCSKFFRAASESSCKVAIFLLFKIFKIVEISKIQGSFILKLKSQNSKLERETNSNSEIQIIEKSYSLIEVYRGIIRIKFDCSNISEKRGKTRTWENPVKCW